MTDEQIEDLYFQHLENIGIEYLEYDREDETGQIFTHVKPEYQLSVAEMKKELGL